MRCRACSSTPRRAASGRSRRRPTRWRARRRCRPPASASMPGGWRAPSAWRRRSTRQAAREGERQRQLRERSSTGCRGPATQASRKIAASIVPPGWQARTATVAINPPSDIVLGVALAADPAKYRAAAERLDARWATRQPRPRTFAARHGERRPVASRPRRRRRGRRRPQRSCAGCQRVRGAASRPMHSASSRPSSCRASSSRCCPRTPDRVRQGHGGRDLEIDAGGEARGADRPQRPGGDRQAAGRGPEPSRQPALPAAALGGRPPPSSLTSMLPYIQSAAPADEALASDSATGSPSGADLMSGAFPAPPQRHSPAPDGIERWTPAVARGSRRRSRLERVRAVHRASRGRRRAGDGRAAKPRRRRSAGIQQPQEPGAARAQPLGCGISRRHPRATRCWRGLPACATKLDINRAVLKMHLDAVREVYDRHGRRHQGRRVGRHLFPVSMRGVLNSYDQADPYGLWVCVVTMGAAYLGAAWQRPRRAEPKAERPRRLQRPDAGQDAHDQRALVAEAASKATSWRSSRSRPRRR